MSGRKLGLSTGPRSGRQVLNPNTDLPLNALRGVEFDETNDRLIVITDTKILSVDPSSGESKELMDLTATVLESKSGDLVNFTVGRDGERLVVRDSSYEGKLIYVDLDAALIDDQNTVGSGYFFEDLTYDQVKDVFYATSANESVIWVIDGRALSATVLSQ